MNIRKKSAAMIGRKMKKSIISLAMALIFLLPCSYGLVINEDGQTLSEASGLKEGDRIILPDGSMYRMVQKEELRPDWMRSCLKFPRRTRLDGCTDISA